jgi:scyllo-inositol 2-dehydrogenase (NADP+)
MSKASPIRLGIVGLGRAGWGMHCPELQGKEDKFQIVAACDLIQQRRDKMAERYGCKTYERVEDLIADPNVEMVEVATRSCDHFAHTMLALKAGKLVNLEKPMCVTYDEAKKLRAAAKSKGALFVRHNRRFEPGFLHIREIIASGLLGEVYQIKLSRVGYARRDDWQTLMRFGGGQLLNWGPHIIDHALQFLDAPVKSIWSDLKRIAAVGDAEDHLKIVLTGTNGRIVDVEISGGAAIRTPEYIVWGSKGGLTANGSSITLRHLDPKQKLEPRRPYPGTPGENFGTPEALNWIEQTIPISPKRSYDIWDELYKAVRLRKPYPITLDEAVEVMKVVSAAKKGTRFERARR